MPGIEIEKLTTTEKIQIMETLWDSLCAEKNNIHSPVWHLELLEQREITLNEGADAFVDWREAKRDILKTVL